MEAEDDEVAQVQVGRLTRGVEPRRRVTEKQLFELTIGSHLNCIAKEPKPKHTNCPYIPLQP